MGFTENTGDDDWTAQRAAWAHLRAADAVSDSRCGLAAAERALARALRHLAVAEQELQAARWAADQMEAR